MSSRARAPRAEIGARIGDCLTVLNAVDDRGPEPVYIVWHHGHWCPMACKVCDSPEQARVEAEILAALSHPNIVRCHGVVESTHLLMEFLEGPTLRHLLKRAARRRLSVSDALRVAIYLGAALSHTHQRGLIHMDVKPSNVIIARGRPVLCDFGIARWQSAPRPRHVHGTDPYIAPEECRRETVTAAADVFGLGVTLYELLTGRFPFPAGVDKDSFPQISETPMPVRHHRRAIPAALDRLVLRCLARDPQERPALPALIPELHYFVRTGPRMWPAGFDPALAPEPEFVSA